MPWQVMEIAFQQVEEIETFDLGYYHLDDGCVSLSGSGRPFYGKMKHLC